jgi:eukaryotic-like serine/threonine-protein kinase
VSQVIAGDRRVIAGRYDLVREIGRGGMGAVWLARDTVLGRDVALKRIGLMPGVPSADLRRVEREARLAARVNHPHVVAVFDLVEEGDESWLVMEYVEGVTLSTFVKRDGALTPDEAAPLLRQAADALAAAHDAGVVHRDIKPSNMLVNRDGEVKLTDFGIARAEADATLTQTGLVTGSPAYLAPEVASGATATEASDVWSWGATLFHVLAGHPPYDVSENLMGALYRIVHEEPPRLADAGWLAPVLEHTMAREPADRWPMARVRDELDRPGTVTVHPTPVGSLDEDGTRVLPSTPSVPVAVPPIVVQPPVAAESGPSHARRRVWPWVASAAVLVVVALVAAAAYLGTRDEGTPSASDKPPPSSPTTSSHSSSATPHPTAASMASFVTTYLSTVTSDQHASWRMLTPSFQKASHGFGSYQKFWRTISSATPHDISADPDAMTVSYAVDYVRTDGSTSTDQVTLQLVQDGSSYLINGEA